MEELRETAERRNRLASYIRANGLPPEIDGPRLEGFNAEQLSKAIKTEIARSHERGWSKISITMDLKDAYALALALES